MRSLRIGSLFSGVGGFDLGLERAGHEVVFQCEFVPYRREVLARHWPDAYIYDDVREVATDDDEAMEELRRLQSGDIGGGADDGSEHGGVDGEGECRLRVDLLCGGFPCQDLSVAGKRAGLAGERSGLFFEFMRIADAVVEPGGWLVAENVPGLLTSNGGADFGIVLATLADLGFHDLAWRVVDSRYFGVPQRRRRVFILARRARGGRAKQVLLEPESGGGDFEASRQARKRPAGGARHGVADALDTQRGGPDVKNAQANQLVACEAADADGVREAPGVPGRLDDPAVDEAPTVTSDFHSPGAGRNVVTVDEGTATTATLTTRYGAMGGQDLGQPGNLVVSPEQTSALTSGFLNGGDSGVPLALQTAFFGQNGIGISTDAYTLDKNSVQAVAYEPVAFTQNSRDEVRLIDGDGSSSAALTASQGAHMTNYIAVPIGWADELMSRPTVDEMGTLRIATTVGAPPPFIVCYSTERPVDPTQGKVVAAWRFGPVPAQDTASTITSGTSNAGVSVPGRRQEDDSNLVVDRTVSWEGDDWVHGDYAQTLVSHANSAGVGPGFNGGDRNVLAAAVAMSRGAPRRDSCRLDPAPDGRRYAAMGDAVTVNVLHWLGERLNEHGRLDDPDLES